MPKRIVMAFALGTLTAAVALAQAPARQRVAPREKPRPRAAVAIIDLRDVAIDKKPPKRLAEPATALRVKPPSHTNAVSAAFSPGQLREVLRDIGLGAVPPNVYARFTPSAMSVPGKGFLFLLVPTWVYPDHVQFFSSGGGGDLTWVYNGPAVVLREPGTYVFDFLVEFNDAPVGTPYTCEAMIGDVPVGDQTVENTGGLQHVLVVKALDAALLALGDAMKSVGIHCFKSSGPQVLAGWTLYLVDVTKL